MWNWLKENSPFIAVCGIMLMTSQLSYYRGLTHGRELGRKEAHADSVAEIAKVTNEHRHFLEELRQKLEREGWRPTK